MPRVNREEFLHQLESVQPGLSSREIIEQSSCFVFQDGKVVTYNDEIACSHECAVGLTGAVKAEPLLAVLRKLSEDELDISQTKNEIQIEGKHRKAGIRFEQDIHLPVGKVESPGKWQSLPEDWNEAVNLVQHCASSDQQQFAMTCIHVHPDFLEASDNFQVTRFKLATGIKKATLIRASSLKHVPNLGMTKFSETETWMHFKNPAGLVLSCRRYAETDGYPDMGPILKMKGHPITIPKGLGDAADRASVFSSETMDENQVLVELRPGKLRVRGTGATGWFQETKKVKYDGPGFAFCINPSLLIDITKRHNDAEITEGKMKVDGGKWRYVTCLSKPVEKEEPAEQEEETKPEAE